MTLGADIELETLDGIEHLRIEAGTESGTVIRLRGKGVPNINRRGRGDLYVDGPRDHADRPLREERKLLEQLADIRGEVTSKGASPRAPSSGDLMPDSSDHPTR